MSDIKEVASTRAPEAVGPYSQAIIVDNLVFTSGSLPIDPATKTMPGDIREQAKQSLENLRVILEEAGTGFGKVVKATVYLADIKDFQAVNEVYASFFSKPCPARSCFAVAALPLGARVEIELVAAK